MWTFRAPTIQASVAPKAAPSFSILVAAHNAAGTIAGAVSSALAQTAPPAEVIVCDDGSTDDLGAALQPFADQIVLLRQENRGAAAARNSAVQVANGDFVVILDADDVFDVRRLEALGALAQECPDLDILTTDVHYVVDGRQVGRFYDANHFEIVDQRSAILRSCFVGGWPAVRRQRLFEVGGFDESLRQAEDWDCWLRLIFSGSSAGLVEAPLMEYRLAVGSLSSDRADGLEGRVRVLEKAARQQRLAPNERQVLRESLERNRARASVARALAGVDLADPREVRRRTPRLIRDRALPGSLRLRAAAAWLAPAWAPSWLSEATPVATRLAAESLSSPSDAGTRPRVALLTWGHVLEDFLRPNGLTIEDYCATFTGSWIFGYAQALRCAGVEPLIVATSIDARRPVATVHAPTGTALRILPASRTYAQLRRLMRNAYGRTVGQTFRGPRLAQLLLYPLLAGTKELAPYASVPAWRLVSLVKREQLDAILCQEYEFPRFDVCVLLGRLLRVPVYATFQGGDYQRWKLERWTRPFAVRSSSGLVIAAAGEINRVRSCYCVPDERIASIPNPIDLDVWRPRDRSEAREALGIRSTARVVAWHGRVQLPKKGLDVLVDSWAAVCSERRDRDLALLLIGDGQDAGALRGRIAARRLKGVVWVDRFLHDPSEIAFLLSAADLYAFPSRHEGFPLAPLEAMACGLPVVATAVSGVKEMVEKEVGTVVPVDDRDAFATALGRLIDESPSRLAKRGQRARSRAELFGLAVVGERLREFLLGA